MPTAPDDILSALRLERRQTPSEEVTQQLLGYLLSGRMRPGARLPSERRLAERLGVGRSAVREAIKSLSLLGLLEVRPGSGAYLSGHTSELLPRVLEWGLLLGEPSMRDIVLEHAGETTSSLAMHEPIIDAVAAGDVEAARRAVEAHMERATRRLRAALDADDQPAAASA